MYALVDLLFLYLLPKTAALIGTNCLGVVIFYVRCLQFLSLWLQNKVQGEVECRQVHFNYPTRPNIPVLKGIDMEVRRGRTVALVGSSGCGKSTIIQLVERFYDPKSGQVVSGQPVATVLEVLLMVF